MTTTTPALSNLSPHVCDTATAARRTHWNGMARQWSLLGPPLRPCAADIAVMERAVRAEGDRCAPRPLRGVLFGVTPEIAEMAWPPGSELLAADRSPEMLGSVWPGDRAGRRAVCGDWIEVLAAHAPFDVAIGDGNLTTLDFPDEWERLARSAYEALSDAGVVIVRCRILPEIPETPEWVFRDLSTRRIGSFHAFKLRLAMALQPAHGSGVRLHDVWQCWRDSGVNEARLHADTGWPLEVIRTMDLYRDKPLRLTFPTRLQTISIFEDGFQLESCVEGAYELGSCNPLLVFRRR